MANEAVTKDNNEKRLKRSRVLNIVLIIVIILLLFFSIPFLLLAFNNKGVSKDVNLIRNLNIALRTDAQAKQQPHENMTEALETAANAGYIVPLINAQKTNNEILWDSKNDIFVYFNAEINDVEYVDVPTNPADKLTMSKLGDIPYLWKICEKVPTQNFSMYWIGTEADVPDVVHAGFDAGVNEIQKDIYYENLTNVAQNVVIRTNSKKSNLTVDAPNDNVTHYGVADLAHVKAVAGHSYTENGEVNLLTVVKGRVVLKIRSHVEAIHFSAKDLDGDGNKETFENIVVRLEGEQELPTFYRDPVLIADDGTLVCEVQKEESEEFIWLTKQGIYEQIQVSETVESEREWVSTSDAATDLAKKVSQDIANTLDIGVVVEEETRDIVVEEGKTAEDYVIDEGKTVEETAEIVEVKKIAKAVVEPLDTTSEDLFSLYMNTQFSSQAAVDKAYKFSAFEKADQEYVDAFYAAEKDGEKIFTMNTNDYSDPEKIEAALDAVEATKGLEARARLEELFEDKGQFINHRVDYEITFSKDIAAGSVALAGYYRNFAENFYDGSWLGFGVSSFDEELNPITLKANTPMRLMDTAFDLTGILDFHMNYGAILGYVRDFSCGFANLSDANEGAVLTVTLNLYELDENGEETGEKIECGKYVETLGKVSAVNAALIGK